MADTLTELSQRNEAFWVGLALYLLGVFLKAVPPEPVVLGGIEPAEVLILVGGGVLVIRILVGSYRILRTTGETGVVGYREGKQDDG